MTRMVQGAACGGNPRRRQTSLGWLRRPGVTSLDDMTRIDPRAMQKMMVRKNFLFKHQMANGLGISYERLTAILVNGEDDVEEELIARICEFLECERQDLLHQDET